MGKLRPQLSSFTQKRKEGSISKNKSKLSDKPHLPLLFYGYVDTLCLDISTSIIGDICQFHSTLYIQ